jgi:hypothetical protein
MMRITPMGTRTFRMLIPFGRVHSLMDVPDRVGQGGHFADAHGHLRNSLVGERQAIQHRRRKPGLLAASISLALADLMRCGGFLNAVGHGAHSAFFLFASSLASARDASRERSASIRICCFKSI